MSLIRKTLKKQYPIGHNLKKFNYKAVVMTTSLALRKICLSIMVMIMIMIIIFLLPLCTKMTKINKFKNFKVLHFAQKRSKSIKSQTGKFQVMFNLKHFEQFDFFDFRL